MSAGTATSAPTGPDDAERRRQQRAWNWYDWANSAYYTTVLAVLFSPYMITVANRAAGCAADASACANTLDVLGVAVAPGSLPFYLTSFATIASAFVLPVVGAFVDRSAHKRWNMGGFALVGALSCMALFLLSGTHWKVGAVAVVVSTIMGGCSLVAYYAILVDISTEEERDGASSRGWAWGYLGGGLLLALNLVLYLGHDTFGVGEAMSVRISLLSAGVWWAAFTVVALARLRDYPPRTPPADGPGPGLWHRSFGQLLDTLREMRAFPMTLTFLVAYLFYNDGIQTVIYAASTYGDKTLGFGNSVLIGTILLIQFVAWGGALSFGRLADRFGSYRAILAGTYAWMAIVVVAIVLPAHNAALFFAVAVAIGIVLGGTQALSRSFFSLLIPRGREGAYFGVYNACERGTSWFGTLLFGVVFQLTGSYRPAILALIVFFVLGVVFLHRLDAARGIREAGNAVPAAV